MKSFFLRAAAIPMIFAGIALVNWPATAETTRVQLPPNQEGFVHYTGRERGESVTHIKTTPDVLELVKAGQPVPNGATFVLEDFRNGELYRTFVMQKGEGWGNEYDEERRTGDWQFQWFWADGSVNMDENTARCQSCHQGAAGSDFLFTTREMQAFEGTPL